MSFNFAGAKSLNEIMKTELIQDKSKTEIADLWYSYHESKVSIVLYDMVRCGWVMVEERTVQNLTVAAFYNTTQTYLFIGARRRNGSSRKRFQNLTGSIGSEVCCLLFMYL